MADNSVDKLIDKTIERRREDILDSYESLLARFGAVGRGGPAGSSHARIQAATALDEVRRRLREPYRDKSSCPGQVGPATAGAAVWYAAPPAESLRDADLLCRAILGGVATWLPEHTDRGPAMVRVAVATLRVLLERFTTAAMSYVGYLRERLHQSHAEERRRVARELHDVIAHSVVLALQDLELFNLYRDRNPRRAAVRLDRALQELHDAVDVIRSLAQDLRRSDAEEGLQCALRAYVDSLPEGPATEMRFVGDESAMPEAVRAELFLVLREALRNARTHGRASSVRLDVEVTSQRVHASVVDDGAGFDERGEVHGTGLLSMHERVELMGGTLAVSSTPGKGTAVHVEVALGIS